MATMGALREEGERKEKVEEGKPTQILSQLSASGLGYHYS